jgi:hypothetical protein
LVAILEMVEFMTRARAFVVFVIAVAAAGLGFWLVLPRHRIDREHYLMVKEGMTEEEVEELLGAPPGNYDGYVERGQFWTVEYVGDVVNYFPSVWAGRHGTIRVYFVQGSQGTRSADCTFYPSLPETWFARLTHSIIGSSQQTDDGW